jgi:hypothetical protein
MTGSRTDSPFAPEQMAVQSRPRCRTQMLYLYLSHSPAQTAASGSAPQQRTHHSGPQTDSLLPLLVPSPSSQTRRLLPRPAPRPGPLVSPRQAGWDASRRSRPRTGSRRPGCPARAGSAARRSGRAPRSRPRRPARCPPPRPRRSAAAAPRTTARAGSRRRAAPARPGPARSTTGSTAGAPRSGRAGSCRPRGGRAGLRRGEAC